MEEAPEITHADETYAEPAEQSTLLGALRAKYEELGKVAYLDYGIPGYDEMIKIRFTNRLSWIQITSILKRAEKDKKNPYSQLHAQCDIIIQCTHSLWACQNAGEAYGRLDNASTHEPATWPELADMLGIVHDGTARSAIRAIFRQDLRISSTSAALMKWIQKEDEDAGEEVQGES